MPTVASSVDLVVHLSLDEQGVRRVQEIVAVPGRVEADVIETESIFERVDGELQRAHGMPPRLDRFAHLGIDIHQVLEGAL
ncbi:hypothetical protein EXE57_16915 [Nocardioides euryhalodurans]|uniref:Uncharacterized protein n=1 Tax=Nocardioides euryhalodurans TaxID=2518370 RepID=A0A4P7GNU9_9ACTN|nr:hypothetical protein EXE57_16915 [Nocardioides euryhalodurans]